MSKLWSGVGGRFVGEKSVGWEPGVGTPAGSAVGLPSGLHTCGAEGGDGSQSATRCDRKSTVARPQRSSPPPTSTSLGSSLLVSGLPTVIEGRAPSQGPRSVA
jgi:hypothetical protein